MDRKRWTVVLVPPRNEPAREFTLPGWSFRALGYTAIGAAFLIIGSVAVLFTPWGTPGARIVAAQNESLQRDIAAIEARFRVLEDTLVMIARLDEQMRLIAGLPAADSQTRDVSAAANLITASMSDGELAEPTARRPFLGRLGWAARPDVEGLITRASDLSRSFSDVSDKLERNFERFANTPSIMPTAGWLTSQFTKSRFHPILHENRPHEAIDVTAPTGTPIVAPASGTVVFAGTDKGYGLSVVIDHGNGIMTRFAHCSRIAVRTGQRVTRSQLIAAVGMTGLATAPHLHYEVHVNGKAVDPLTYVLPDIEP